MMDNYLFRLSVALCSSHPRQFIVNTQYLRFYNHDSAFDFYLIIKLNKLSRVTIDQFRRNDPKNVFMTLLIQKNRTVSSNQPMRGQDAVNTDHRLSSQHGSFQTSKCLHFISWPHKPFILATNWRPPWLQISPGLWLADTHHPSLWLAASLAVLCQGHPPHQPE